MAFKMKGFSQHAGVKKEGLGPRASKKKVKEDDSVPLSPGYEDPIKIQKIQREGLTPNSQKFSKIAAKNTKKSPAKNIDIQEEDSADWWETSPGVDRTDLTRKEKKIRKKTNPDNIKKKKKKKAKRKDRRKKTIGRIKDEAISIGGDVLKGAAINALTPKERKIVNPAAGFNVQFGR
tara:strand:+ start:1405 stop:1935 length:531 start_codon:yes stop_codon:yes gene_type:complete